MHLISSITWPPNSQDLNPVACRILSGMQEMVYRTKIRDVYEFRQRILDALDELHQLVIDASIKQWQARIYACIRADGNILSTNCDSV